ncbi:SDR family oxidoreductase [Pseudomonas helleri]|uniref:SDR family oxidoreductase n=1 Tax=Pseudomonas helleri TaxID=1608996 RepID=UPI0024322236|nr:SDR family oxidoreductase [Pseudomonas helleri]
MRRPKAAVVSGGTCGIGRALVEALVDDGYRVGFSGRVRERVEAVVTSVASRHPHRIVGITGDASLPGHATALITAVRETFPAWASVYVLCAGQGLPGTLTGSDPARWEALLHLNLLGAMHQMRECAALFGQMPEGVRDLVVIGSTVGRTLSDANPVYGATKVALHSLVEALRRERCATGMRVSLIEPGFVASGFQASAGYDPEWFAGIEREQGPLLRPEDIARVVRFIVQQPPHVHIDDVRVRPTRQRV